MSSYVYKVRRKSDGKFSTGTSEPRWTKQGRVFTSRSAVLHHLAWFLDDHYAWTDSEGGLRWAKKTKPPVADDYEVVEYAIFEHRTLLADMTALRPPSKYRR